MKRWGPARAAGAGIAVVAIVAFFILLVVIGPIFTIWAFNRLFGMAWELNFWNWLSVAWLQVIVYGATRK